METISVPLQNCSYPIWVDNGVINSLEKLFLPMNRGQIWVLFSQKNVYDIISKKIYSHLKSNGFKIEVIILDDGEKAKTFASIEDIFNNLSSFNCDRSSTFIAVGGGVTGDVCGFAAATFMRGVEYIQIPTSLLAMVDSSIGGKTGINLSAGKNLVGAFWQPKAVVIDPELLKTLPDREFYSAMGEIIKYGAIADISIIDFLQNNLDNFLNVKNLSIISDLIIKCAKIKSKIIVEDQYEVDQRRILNFGHTIGHALETYFGFETLRHGEAVCYGMIAAAQLSVDYANLNQEDYQKLCKVINSLSLPKLTQFNPSDILKIVYNDKKNKYGDLYFILLESIGKTIIINNVKESSIINVLEKL